MSNGVWNLSELYSGPDDPNIERDLQEAEQRVNEFADKWRPRVDYLVNPGVLREALDELEVLNRAVGTGDRPGYYVALAKAIDTSDAALKSLEATIDKRSTVMGNSLEFFWLAVGRIEATMQQQMLASAVLEPYHVRLSLRFEAAAHDLDESVEVALNDILPLATSSWTSMVNEALSGTTTQMKIGDTVRDVPFSELASYLSTHDAVLAEQANAAHVKTATSFASMAEHELNAVITAKSNMNRLRGYTRADGQSFIRYGLPAGIVDSMLEVIESRYSIAHGYYELKSRLLGRASIQYHQRALAYGSLPSGYTFDQATTILRDVLEALHPDFAVEFDMALASGHIDHVPRKGKRGGAACWHNLIDQPVYMMLNFTGQLNDVETLGHEFGHYLNNRHMQMGERCTGLTYGTVTPMAETASTFFEQYVLDAVSGGVDDETRLAIQLASLNSGTSTIFRQAAATRFEQDLYVDIDAKGHLSKDQIGELFTRHMAAYMGPYVTHDDGTDVGWVHWMHFRRGFYNYGYTFAQLVSSALQDRVNADPAYISEFRRMLETGQSQRTADLLSSLDLNVEDGSVWNTGLDKLERLLHSTTELATKLGKI